MKVKQVIVINMKVPMGIGRLAAQAAHASISAILNLGEYEDDSFKISNMNQRLKYWMKESFTKIVLKEWGEDRLLNLIKKATELDIPTAIMKDDGHLTAIALGPDDSDVIDAVTEKLPLL